MRRRSARPEQWERVPTVRESVSIACGPTGTLRIVVVADTHSEPHPRALAQVATLRPDAVLHAGDIGELRVLDALREIAPLTAVRGNIDSRGNALPDTVSIEIVGAAAGNLRMLLTHIAVSGPRITAGVAREATAEGASLVVCGHSHIPFIGRDRGLTVFNPGSIGPRRFSLPIVFGVIDIALDGVRLAHHDVETGLPWNPPELRA